MNAHRNSWELWKEILEVCKDGTCKTHIVYKCNMNFKIVEDHIDYLLERGLLKQTEQHYKTTPKGDRFLEIYGKIKAILGEGEE
jgi:predicted transcriptional regulator